jgi:hypothetical protein
VFEKKGHFKSLLRTGKSANLNLPREVKYLKNILICMERKIVMPCVDKIGWAGSGLGYKTLRLNPPLTAQLKLRCTSIFLHFLESYTVPLGENILVKIQKWTTTAGWRSSGTGIS